MAGVSADVSMQRGLKRRKGKSVLVLPAQCNLHAAVRVPGAVMNPR